MSHGKWACHPLENIGFVAQDRNPEMREGAPTAGACQWHRQGCHGVTMKRDQGQSGETGNLH